MSTTTKIIGYALSVVGLGVVALSAKIASLSFIASLGQKALVYTILGGIVLIAGGIAIALTDSSSNKVPHASEEVPIYQGEGRHKKIVGYKKAG